MILVDTGVWIDHFRGRASPEAVTLAAAIERDEDLCISGIILTEILQGIASEKEYHSVRSLLGTLIFLSMPKESYELAANIYRRAKENGCTVRNTIDCLIAACAVFHDAALLQNDKDYQVIHRFSKLKLVSV